MGRFCCVPVGVRAPGIEVVSSFLQRVKFIEEQNVEGDQHHQTERHKRETEVKFHAKELKSVVTMELHQNTEKANHSNITNTLGIRIFIQVDSTLHRSYAAER